MNKPVTTATILAPKFKLSLYIPYFFIQTFAFLKTILFEISVALKLMLYGSEVERLSGRLIKTKFSACCDEILKQPKILCQGSLYN